MICAFPRYPAGCRSPDLVRCGSCAWTFGKARAGKYLRHFAGSERYHVPRCGSTVGGTAHTLCRGALRFDFGDRGSSRTLSPISVQDGSQSGNELRDRVQNGLFATQAPQSAQQVKQSALLRFDLFTDLRQRTLQGQLIQGMVLGIRLGRRYNLQAPFH